MVAGRVMRRLASHRFTRMVAHGHCHPLGVRHKRCVGASEVNRIAYYCMQSMGDLTTRQYEFAVLHAKILEIKDFMVMVYDNACNLLA